MKINEIELTPGQRRKLRALRKSLGDRIADAAFGEWLKNGQDKNAEMIAEALVPLIDQGLTIPRGGYLIMRGRGRVIVEPAR